MGDYVFDSDELTKRFTQALFAKYPDWQHYAEPVMDGSGNVAVEVKVPQAGSKRYLYMLTTGGEITVGFDLWHTHIGTYPKIGVGESVEEALNVIGKFVGEQTVVTVVERGGHWIWSCLEDCHDLTPDLPEGRIRRLSWKGTLDQEFERTEAG